MTNRPSRVVLAVQFLLALIVSTGALAGTEPLAAALHVLRAEADTAEKSHDWPRARAALNNCLQLAPDHPGLLLRLASADVEIGAIEDAHAILMRYASLGLTLDAAQASQFDALLASPQFTTLAAAFLKNTEVIGRPRLVSELGRKPMVAEGIAFDPLGHRLLISAVAAKTVYASRRLGIAPMLAADAAVQGLFGMAVDASARILWIAEASGPGIPQSNQAAATALLGIDLPNGRIRRRFSLAVDGTSPHQLNDVSVAHDHTVFASDAESGEVYRLAPGAQTLDVLVAKGNIWSAQGMVVSEDGASLIVADYGTGLRRVDLGTGAITLLHSRFPAALAGIDGLSNCDGKLIATQNGTTPERILMITLTARRDGIRSVRVLAQNGPAVRDITLGTCINHRFAYVSGSQWANFGADGTPVTTSYSTATVQELSLEH